MPHAHGRGPPGLRLPRGLAGVEQRRLWRGLQRVDVELHARQAQRVLRRLDEVVRALNLLGANVTDLISILQAMKTAGALRAEIEVI